MSKPGLYFYRFTPRDNLITGNIGTVTKPDGNREEIIIPDPGELQKVIVVLHNEQQETLGNEFAKPFQASIETDPGLQETFAEIVASTDINEIADLVKETAEKILAAPKKILQPSPMDMMMGNTEERIIDNSPPRVLYISHISKLGHAEEPDLMKSIDAVARLKVDGIVGDVLPIFHTGGPTKLKHWVEAVNRNLEEGSKLTHLTFDCYGGVENVLIHTMRRYLDTILRDPCAISVFRDFKVAKATFRDIVHFALSFFGRLDDLRAKALEDKDQK